LLLSAFCFTATGFNRKGGRQSKMKTTKKIGKYRDLVYTERLKLERFKKNITIKELAARVGISFVTYSQIENGHVEPKISVASKISEILGKPTSYFFKIYEKETEKKEVS
jgi:DNA-binding XRE family transcriptional regulator